MGLLVALQRLQQPSFAQAAEAHPLPPGSLREALLKIVIKASGGEGRRE
jgi:hypothetical protein